MIAKRKAGILIVPLITIVLCVAALGGVAYALTNTTVSNEGGIESGSDVLIFTNSSGVEQTSTFDDVGTLYVSTQTVIATPEVTATVEGNVTVTFYFKLVSTDGQLQEHYALSTYSITLANSGVVTVGTAKAANNTITLTAGAITLVKQSDSSAASASNLDTGVVYKGTCTISVDPEDKDVTFENATAINDAGDVVTALGNASYTISLSAGAVTP